jgi:hypothetical protein
MAFFTTPDRAASWLNTTLKPGGVTQRSKIDLCVTPPRITRRKEADKRASIDRTLVCSAFAGDQIVSPDSFLSALLLCTLPLGCAECGLATW